MLVQFRDNLTARLQLLEQLHMKLPEDLNAAEQQLRDGDLPQLDQQTQLLKRQIQVVTALDRMSSMCLHLTCSGLIGSGPHFYCAATHQKLLLEISISVCDHNWISRFGWTVQHRTRFFSAPAPIHFFLMA